MPSSPTVPRRSGQPALGALVFAAFGIAGLVARRLALPVDAPPRNDAATALRRAGIPDDHGLAADRPGDIPRRGWWDILRRVQSDITRTNLSLIAAGTAFYAFLAIPSALAALVALYGLLFDPQAIGDQIQAAAGVLPAETVGLLGDQLRGLTAKPRSAVSAGFAIGLVLALWSSRSATSSLITALNVAYGEREKRGFLRFQATALLLTLCAVLFVVVALTLVAVLPVVVGFLPLGDLGRTLVTLLRWPLLAVMVAIGLAALYRLAPCRATPRWEWVSWGAALATLLWLLGSVAFSLYVTHFAGYEKTYGSLGTVVVMLMWLYLSCFVVTLGAAINAETERQTARDSTTGAPAPRGVRGAVAADTVAADTVAADTVAADTVAVDAAAR